MLPLAALYTWLLFYDADTRILGGAGVLTVSGIFCVLFSTYVLIRICKNMTKEERIVKYIARNSILFYFLSGAIPNTLAWAMSHLGLTMGTPFVFFLTLALSLPLAYVLSLPLSRLFR